MNREYMGTSYADLWASYHKKLSSYESWRTALKRAKLYASACYHANCKADDAVQYNSPDPAVSPYISNIVSYNCANRECSLLSPERFQEYLRKHPHACTTDPELAKAAGNCPTLAGRTMGITHDEIRAKRDRIAWHADKEYQAVVDYLHRRGINARVMGYQEIIDFIDYCNEMDAGDPLAPILIEATAPKVPTITEPTYGPTPTPTGPEPLSLATLPAFLRSLISVEGLRKNWPGLALGAALVLLKTRRRKKEGTT